VKNNNSKKHWKKTKRQRKLSKLIVWKIKLPPEAEAVLRAYCLKNNISLETGVVRALREFVKQHLTNS